MQDQNVYHIGEHLLEEFIHLFELALNLSHDLQTDRKVLPTLIYLLYHQLLNRRLDKVYLKYF